MTSLLFYLDPHSTLSLQAQIRQKLIDAINVGSLAPGSRLPSSRELAEQLRVARNTVVLVYEELVDEGYLISRARSGVFVPDNLQQKRVGVQSTIKSVRSASSWLKRLDNIEKLHSEVTQPNEWWRHPYPFLDGCFDDSLYPLVHWREANRLASSTRLVQQHLRDEEGSDAAELIDLIRSKILPRRGIQAAANEVLIMFSSRQALSLILELFVPGETQVAMEEPGLPAVRELLQRRAAAVIAQPVDTEGICVDERLQHTKILYVTPSHQAPTGVTMTMTRRDALLKFAHQHEQLIIEDDSDGEVNFLTQPLPALYSLDQSDRVIYLGALPRVLAAGVSLSFIVAAPEVIAALRHQRNLLSATPPLLYQYTAAQFITLGFYDALLLRLHTVFRERWNALRDALNHYLPQSIATIPNHGGTVHWVSIAEHIDLNTLIQEAAKRGILLESVQGYFAYPNAQNAVRMGITALSTDKIREGVATFAQLLRELGSGKREQLSDVAIDQLHGEQLRQLMSNAILRTTTVYGHPCTIQLLADGKMIGRAGYDDEDQDCGRWWVDGDCWYRQWQHWSYGEAIGFYVVLQKQTLKWFNKQGEHVDTALLQL